MGNIRLVVSDLDGCLLDGEGKLPGDFDRTLSLMRVHGVTFAAASGRAASDTPSASPPSRKYVTPASLSAASSDRTASRFTFDPMCTPVLLK